MAHTLFRRACAEALGSCILVAAVVGSGIMGTALSDNLALTLLINAVATVAVLGVLIWTVGPISGAQFNPAVTGVAVFRREMPLGEGVVYVVVQVVGACFGAILANTMFDLAPLEVSSHARSGTGLWLGELVATAGLLLVIGAVTRTGRGHLGAILVPAWIGTALLFTSSTSFANPAVTIGRTLSDTFAGIAPASVPVFIVVQLIGAAIGAALTEFFYPRRGVVPEPLDLPDPIHHGPHDHSPSETQEAT